MIETRLQDVMTKKVVSLLSLGGVPDNALITGTGARGVLRRARPSPQPSRWENHLRNLDDIDRPKSRRRAAGIRMYKWGRRDATYWAYLICQISVCCGRHADRCERLLLLRRRPPAGVARRRRGAAAARVFEATSDVAHPSRSTS